jgi:hypothetical protein
MWQMLCGYRTTHLNNRRSNVLSVLVLAEGGLVEACSWGLGSLGLLGDQGNTTLLSRENTSSLSIKFGQ